MLYVIVHKWSDSCFTKADKPIDEKDPNLILMDLKHPGLDVLWIPKRMP